MTCPSCAERKAQGLCVRWGAPICNAVEAATEAGEAGYLLPERRIGWPPCVLPYDHIGPCMSDDGKRVADLFASELMATVREESK